MSDGAQATTEVSTPAPEADGPKEIFVGQEPPKDPAAEAGTKTETTKPTGLEEPNEEENRDESGRFKKRNGGENLQNRIDELTRSRREAERDAEYWRTRAQAYDQQGQQPAKDSKPARDQFATDEDYQEALVDYKVEQRLQKADQERKVKEQSETKASSWDSKVQAAKADLPDWDEVMSDESIQVAMHVADAIMEHDHGAKVAHHLAQNPDVVEKLNGLPPLKVAFEIAKIATKFDKPADPGSSKPVAEVSKAPPPPSARTGAGRSTEKSPGDMDMDEYIAFRNKQGASFGR